MNISNVGIVGAGQMGNGIAHVFALAGFDVMLNDISSDALIAAIETITANMTRQVARDRITQDDMDAALTPVLGDSSVVTWVDEKSMFGPGRLDWLLYDDSRSELVDAYMLNTRVLTDTALERLGLERDDSKASDHLPMVVDLVRLD